MKHTAAADERRIRREQEAQWKAETKFRPNTEFLAKYLTEGDIAEAILWQTKLRSDVKYSGKQCIGCRLGDASPLMHDYGYSCEYGAGAGY